MCKGIENMELPKRKSTRLKNYNYNAPGIYFITICTQDKKQILSRITKTSNVNEIPDNILTNYGTVAEKFLKQMSHFYENIILEKYVIMPNHIHLLIRIIETEKQTHNQSNTTDAANSLVSKFVGTFKRFCNKEFCKNIWQSRSNDHVVRSERDYINIWNYIDTNVIRWEKDCFYE